MNGNLEFEEYIDENNTIKTEYINNYLGKPDESLSI